MILHKSIIHRIASSVNINTIEIYIVILHIEKGSDLLNLTCFYTQIALRAPYDFSVIDDAIAVLGIASHPDSRYGTERVLR